MKRKINLNEVTAKEPIKVKTQIQSSQVDLPKEEVSKSSPFNLEIEVRRKPVGYDVKGKVTGEVELTCSKCNKKFTHKVEQPFHYELMPTSEIGGGQIKKGDLDIKFSDETVMDLAEVVNEQVLLNLPVKPVCSKECEESTISFSVGEEEQVKEKPEKEVDPRWAKLKELQNKLSEKE
ncbi:YceD family protein [Thermovibrio ammonificans]